METFVFTLISSENKLTINLPQPFSGTGDVITDSFAMAMLLGNVEVGNNIKYNNVNKTYTVLGIYHSLNGPMIVLKRLDKDKGENKILFEVPRTLQDSICRGNVTVVRGREGFSG